MPVEVVPSPKSHLYPVGDPVLMSVKVTLIGAFPDFGDPHKFETGFFKAVPSSCEAFCGAFAVGTAGWTRAAIVSSFGRSLDSY